MVRAHYWYIYITLQLANIREIQEVRLGLRSKDFSDRREDDMKRFGVEETCSFVILYGTEFRLKMMSLVGEYKWLL